jgi:hypothetical protein
MAALLLSLAGCASFHDANRERLESFPQHYAQFDAILGWEVRGVGGETVIDGGFRNIRFYAMDNIEIWVEVNDSAGKRLARSVAFLVPNLVRMEETAPFTVKLPVRAAPGTKLHFTYKYNGMDGAGSSGAGNVNNWMQSFDAVVAAER